MSAKNPHAATIAACPRTAATNAAAIQAHIATVLKPRITLHDKDARP